MLLLLVLNDEKSVLRTTEKQKAQLAFCELLARDAFVRTNRRAIAMTFVRLSVCLGRACIVIILCRLARI